MELYSMILFVHIVAGMGMAAALATIFACEARGRGATTPAELRRFYESEERIAAKMKILALVLAASGLYMTHVRWSISSAWVIVAIIVFVYLASTGPLVFGRRAKAAVLAAERAGMITEEVRSILGDPILETMGRLRVALLALMVFLMTTKPGIAVTLASVVVALGLGVASGAVMRERARAVRETAQQ